MPVQIKRDIVKELENRVRQAEKALDGKTYATLRFRFPKVDNINEVYSPFDGAASRLESATADAKRELVIELNAKLTAAIKSNVWGWRDGTRDIVDTGALAASQSVSIQGEAIVIDYGVDYAVFVHEGGYIRPYGNESAEAVFVPGRPWADAVIYGNGPVPSVDFDNIIRSAVLRAF